MKQEEINKLDSKEVDEELFRELIQWEKKELVIHIIGEMNTDNKRIWIKEYFELD